MLKVESTNLRTKLLNHINSEGAVYESSLWQIFMSSDTIEERAKIVKALDELIIKGLVRIKHNYYVSTERFLQ